MVDLDSLQAKLKLLNDAFASQLPGKIAQIEESWQQVLRGVSDRETMERLHRMVHSLTGSGKTFGFTVLSDVARNLEDYLKQLLEQSQSLSEQQKAQVGLLLCELSQVSIRRNEVEIASYVSALQNVPQVIERKKIYIVDDDELINIILQDHLSSLGYEIRTFNNLHDFKQAMLDDPEVVVLMDIAFPEGPLAGVELIQEMQAQRKNKLPVMFISSHNSIDVRLAAVRAGGVAYFSKPINIGAMIDKLENFMVVKPLASYRILLVDDSVLLSQYFASVLQQVGMEVRVINDPLTAIDHLAEFHPDLIIVDLYMPGCNGMELASLIRQMDGYVCVPIIFLSVERDLNKQYYALEAGADDFLTKPIQVEHLVSAVMSRIKRSDLLRSFMLQDSMTGLLNPVTLKMQLERELARVSRIGNALTYAAIDIDGLKSLNDSYGHMMGDRVIKNLALLLKQRLRENDLLGRNGGQEFAVVLVDCGMVEAGKILDEIRETFATTLFSSVEQRFNVTLSVGVADVVDFKTVDALLDGASRALCRAKSAGRNQVVLASK